MIDNDLNLRRKLRKMGDPLTPFSDMYPEETWVNLSGATSEAGMYGILNPTRALHPLTSITGATYFSIAAITMTNILRNKEDKLRVISTGDKIDIRAMDTIPSSQRKSIVPLIHLLLFERYVRDASFRRAIKIASEQYIYMDAHQPGHPSTYTYFSGWYPELINNIICCDRTGEPHDFLSNGKDGNKWYMDFLYCEEETFLTAYTELVEQFYEVRDTPILGKYWLHAA